MRRMRDYALARKDKRRTTCESRQNLAGFCDVAPPGESSGFMPCEDNPVGLKDPAEKEEPCRRDQSGGRDRGQQLRNVHDIGSGRKRCTENYKLVCG